MYKQIFVRALWRDAMRSYRFEKRIIKHELPNAAENISRLSPSVMYCWGEKNNWAARDLGFDTKLVALWETSWGNETESTWRHKLEAWRLAFQYHDEMIFVDLDIAITRDIPSDLWDRLRDKGPFQANLCQYKRKRATWRDTDVRKLPSAAFVYIADKTIPQKLIDIWEEHRQWTAEDCMAFLMDQMTGGWQGPEKWNELFDPYCCKMIGFTAYDSASKKDAIFINKH